MSKTIGTPGAAPTGRATGAAPPAARNDPDKAAETRETRPGAEKPTKGSGLVAKVAQKKGDAAVARRARADAARAARGPARMEEPKDAGDVDGQGADDGIEGTGHKLHRAGVHKSFGADDLDDLLKSEAEAESGAVTERGVGRKGMGGGMGGDGFEGGQDRNREAYEQYLRGNVQSDAERFDNMRKGGAADTFRPDLTPEEVERLGAPRAATHLVRLYDQLTLAGNTHEECVGAAMRILVGFTRPESVRKVLMEMESRPIRDVYPLEVLLKILDENPAALPGVARGSGVILNPDELASGEKCFAGHPFSIHVPVEARIKSFALIGGARPGYEFFPAPDVGKYTMLVDTPGRWTFAVLCAPLTALGRIQREAADGIVVETFDVTVHRMGRKGLLADGADDADDAPDLAADPAPDPVEEDAGAAGAGTPTAPATAPSLAEQLRAALDTVVRHDEGLKTTTYSWACALWRPGALMEGEPVLRVVVERAAPFDVAWAKAAEAIARKQREHEPSRRPISLVDVQSALQRARVR